MISNSYFAQPHPPTVGNKSRPGVWQRDRMYLCVPGVDSVPSREVSLGTFFLPLDSQHPRFQTQRVTLLRFGLHTYLSLLSYTSP
jgi:hypothetical protein